MAGKVKKEKDLPKAQRWQDVKVCDRCGKKADIKASAPSEGDNRELLLCKPHVEEHAEALKHQKFVLTDL